MTSRSFQFLLLGSPFIWISSKAVLCFCSVAPALPSRSSGKGETGILLSSLFHFREPCHTQPPLDRLTEIIQLCMLMLGSVIPSICGHVHFCQFWRVQVFCSACGGLRVPPWCWYLFHVLSHSSPASPCLLPDLIFTPYSVAPWDTLLHLFPLTYGSFHHLPSSSPLWGIFAGNTKDFLKGLCSWEPEPVFGACVSPAHPGTTVCTTPILASTILPQIPPATLTSRWHPRMLADPGVGIQLPPPFSWRFWTEQQKAVEWDPEEQLRGCPDSILLQLEDATPFSFCGRRP